MPRQALRTLAHHIDLELLLEAYRLTRKDGAVGVEGQTASEYAENLKENLQNLLERAKSRAYRAPPVRRVRISKAGGKTRPIGIPTFEDKVLQRAVAIVSTVYEQDFRECSYGFRPGRSAHRSRRGVPIVRRKTAPSRMTCALTSIRQWCRAHRHDPITEQHRARGRYYALETLNFADGKRNLQQIRDAVAAEYGPASAR